MYIEYWLQYNMQINLKDLNFKRQTRSNGLLCQYQFSIKEPAFKMLNETIDIIS